MKVLAPVDDWVIWAGRGADRPARCRTVWFHLLSIRPGCRTVQSLNDRFGC